MVCRACCSGSCGISLIAFLPLLLMLPVLHLIQPAEKRFRLIFSMSPGVWLHDRKPMPTSDIVSCKQSRKASSFVQAYG